jgi:endonuclease/exonuclease/phosphatase family metal-dependent hydrolase
MMKMREWLLAGLVGCMLAFAAHAGSLNVIALNIEWFPGQWAQALPEEKARHFADTVPVMQELAADIFIGSEICEKQPFRDLLDTVPGLTLHVISNFGAENTASERRSQQIVIASRLNAFAGWSEAWQPEMEGLHRGFAFAALENPHTGRLILVYGLHLKSNRSDTPEEAQRNYDIRDAATRQLLEHIQRMEEQFAERGVDGIIIGGDINTNHDGQFGDHVVALIEDAGFWNTWRRIPAAERPTWKGREERFNPTTFDYIFLRGFGEPDATVIEIPLHVSDHNAVAVKIDLPVAVIDEAGDPEDVE